jgi:gamma-glutamylcyclotransferase (GGCT)/AIG2-like uncharacterized protein YtfP
MATDGRAIIAARSASIRSAGRQPNARCRPYGTACTHEHACIRCPLLRIDPTMLARLDELEADLLACRDRAETEGWLGEIEDIELTLTYVAQKRMHSQRLARANVITLGMPGSR